MPNCPKCGNPLDKCRCTKPLSNEKAHCHQFFCTVCGCNLDQLSPDEDKLTQILREHGCERGIARLVINSMPQWIKKG